MTPWVFDRLTPREFRLMSEGHERAWDRLAKMVVWITQVNFKEAIVARDILHGRPMPRK